MHARTIGDWSRWLVAFIAFSCTFGTTLTAADGYSRANTEAFRRLKVKRATAPARSISGPCSAAPPHGGDLVFQRRARTDAEICHDHRFSHHAGASPWLNLMLVRGGAHRISGGMLAFSWLGLIYLAGFAAFLLQLVGVFG